MRGPCGALGAATQLVWKASLQSSHWIIGAAGACWHRPTFVSASGPGDSSFPSLVRLSDCRASISLRRASPRAAICKNTHTRGHRHRLGCLLGSEHTLYTQALALLGERWALGDIPPGGEGPGGDDSAHLVGCKGERRVTEHAVWRFL